MMNKIMAFCSLVSILSVTSPAMALVEACVNGHRQLLSVVQLETAPDGVIRYGTQLIQEFPGWIGACDRGETVAHARAAALASIYSLISTMPAGRGQINGFREDNVILP